MNKLKNCRSILHYAIKKKRSAIYTSDPSLTKLDSLIVAKMIKTIAYRAADMICNVSENIKRVCHATPDILKRKGVNNMLPVLPPLEKTRIELKRGVLRLELYVKANDDQKARDVLKVLKKAIELIDKD